MRLKIFIGFILVGSGLLAQDPPRVSFPTRLPKQSFQLDLLARSDSSISSSRLGYMPTGQVRYGTFFCDMELKSVKKFGVMIKIHAGEYDKYMERSNDK